MFHGAPDDSRKMTYSRSKFESNRPSLLGAGAASGSRKVPAHLRSTSSHIHPKSRFKSPKQGNSNGASITSTYSPTRSSVFGLQSIPKGYLSGSQQLGTRGRRDYGEHVMGEMDTSSRERIEGAKNLAEASEEAVQRVPSKTLTSPTFLRLPRFPLPLASSMGAGGGLGAGPPSSQRGLQVTERSQRLCEEYRDKVEQEKTDMLRRRTLELQESMGKQVSQLMDMHRRRR